MFMLDIERGGRRHLCSHPLGALLIKVYVGVTVAPGICLHAGVEHTQLGHSAPGGGG
jgi:hypothetical protein